MGDSGGRGLVFEENVQAGANEHRCDNQDIKHAHRGHAGHHQRTYGEAEIDQAQDTSIDQVHAHFGTTALADVWTHHQFLYCGHSFIVPQQAALSKGNQVRAAASTLNTN